MKSVVSINFETFHLLASELSEEIKSSGRGPYVGIYGIPRGGAPLAAFLSAKLDLQLLSEPKDGCLVVDDICDSGKTMERISESITIFASAVLVEKFGSRYKCTFVASRAGSESWFEFPWEKNEAPAEDSITRILQYLGEDPERDGLKDTPRRVIKSYREIYAGYSMDPVAILDRQFESEVPVDEVIISKDIPFTSTCEHHMLPFVGVAHVGYIPGHGGKIVGLSKLARVVDCFALRLQNQERITQQVANAMSGILKARAAAVVIESAHSCMSCRGVKKTGSTMVTSCMQGLFREDANARNEFMRLIGK